MRTILAIDVGSPDFVGILDRSTHSYDPYWNAQLFEAVKRIEQADEVVTFNGTEYDLPRLAMYVGREHLLLTGIHTDMLCVCWNRGYFGKGLKRIFEEHFGRSFAIPNDPYAENNKADCEMTLALWESWKRGTLAPSDPLFVDENR